MSYSERVVHIRCGQDRMLGILHSPPPGKISPRAVLVLVGGPQYRVGSHRQFLLAARYLAANGHAVLRFDFRGMGDSSGDMRGFEHVRDDCLAAVDTLLREQPGVDSVCVFGLCDAASAALLHCTSDARIDSLVLANPWVRTEAGQAATMVRHYYGSRFFQKSFWRKLLSGGVDVFGSVSGLLASWKTSRQRIESRPRNFVEGMRAGLERFKKPVLLMMSGRDLTAREFDDLFKADPLWSKTMGGAAVKRVDLERADHTFSARSALNSANSAIMDFLRGLPSSK